MGKNKTDIWLPIYVGDYLADTMHLTTEQHGAYFLLILAYWKNRGMLAKSRVQGIVRMDKDSWTINRGVVEELFDVKSFPNFWYHKRIEQELQKAYIRRQASENRGKKGMKSRWGNKIKDNSTNSSTNSSTIVEGIVGDNSSPSPSHIKNINNMCIPENVSDDAVEKAKKMLKKRHRSPSLPKPFIPPTLEEAKAFFKENGYSEESGEAAWRYYDEGDWHNRDKKKVLNWKQTFRGVWFKPENKGDNNGGNNRLGGTESKPISTKYAQLTEDAERRFAGIFDEGDGEEPDKNASVD